MTDTDVLESTPLEVGVMESEKTESLDIPVKNKSSAAKNRQPSHKAGLSSLNIPQLRSIATEAGIEGTSSKRKSDLISAIEEAITKGVIPLDIAQSFAEKKSKAKSSPPVLHMQEQNLMMNTPDEMNTPDTNVSSTGTSGSPIDSQGDPKNLRSSADVLVGCIPGNPVDSAVVLPQQSSDNDLVKQGNISVTARERKRKREVVRAADIQTPTGDEKSVSQPKERPARSHNHDNSHNSSHFSSQHRKKSENDADSSSYIGQKNQSNNHNNGNSTNDDDEGNRRRGRRFRERRRGRERGQSDTGTVERISEEERLQPVAGILDVLDNYAFLRTTGYLPGLSDVYVSMNMVRRHGLRRGDHIVGSIKSPKEIDNQQGRQKFNPLVKIEAVNGKDPEAIKQRLDFSKLIPLYPNERLRLETEPHILTTRVIDLIMPIGKGQRALIVSPPKAGKTTILQDMANAIAINNPECYLMVVLVDERPEEVTDMQRSVKGEVISSTFDRPPSDHTAVAELAIERAKRLVEDGEDVVVLLDSITRLGRAYNNSTPASGRILSGGVDSTALYPPKRFLGAARNIEGGGSLTIIATAMVETGSTGDTVIFEEFKGTGNAELKLDRKIAERRVFPAVDVNPSSTRKDELLLSPEEAAIVHKLRRLLSGLDSHQAIDLIISQLKKTRNNVEFLLSVNKSSPNAVDERLE